MRWFTFHSERNAERKVAPSQLGSINLKEERRREKKKISYGHERKRERDSELYWLAFTEEAESSPGLTGIRREGLLGAPARDGGGTEKPLLPGLLL